MVRIYGYFITAISSQITSLAIVYSIVYSDGDQRKHQSSASLAFVREIQRGPVNSPHKWPVTRKMFPCDDVIMSSECPDQLWNVRRCVEKWLTHWDRAEMDNFLADNIFKCILFNENVWISIKISLKFVPKGSINNIPVLVQIIAWRRSFSEPMMVKLPTNMCVTRPQWVNSLLKQPSHSGKRDSS